MGWVRHDEVLPPSGPWADLDSRRAFGPSVLEEADGTLRLWYCGHDGSTARILEAGQRPGEGWHRLGVSIDPGFSGDSDSYGVESPCVVRTPGGYLMAYAGSDGANTRLHMASSTAGHRWVSHGTFMQREEADAVGATHPCLVVTGERWWLFYAGYDGSDNGRRAEILAAVSPTGASWDRVGPILEPDPDEVAVSEPWVLDAQRHLYMFYVTDDGSHSAIATATSDDGVFWHRQGTTLGPVGGRQNCLGVRSPCVLRLHDGRVRLWYAAWAANGVEGDYRLWLAEYAHDPAP